MTNVQFIILIIFLFQFIRLGAQDVTLPDSENYGDRLKLGYVWKGEVRFNPLIVETDYDIEINKLIFGIGLFTKSKEGQTIDGLTLSSKQLNPQVLRFELRPNLFFHDGTRITAEDVKFSYELYRKFSLQSPLLFNTRLINLIETYGTDVIRIRLEKAVPNFSETIGQLPILPKNHYEKWLNFSQISNLTEITPVGAGYYVFSEYLPGRQLKLHVHPDHTFGRGYLDGIDIIFYNTYDQLLDAFLHEKVDLIPVNDKSVIQKISQFSKNIISIDNDYQTLYYINLNTHQIPFKDLSIRKALNYSINKQQIVNNLPSGNGRVAYGVLADKTQINAQSFKSYSYLPLEGLQILLNNRFTKNPDGKLTKDNRELKFKFYFKKGSPLEESIARIISINLGELGINVLPRALTPLEINNQLSQGNYQAVLQQFYFCPESMGETLRKFYLYELNRGNNFQNFRNNSLNLLLSHLTNSLDTKNLSNISKRFQHLLNQYSPCIFLFFEDRNFYALNPRFENVKTSYNQDLNKSITKFNPKNEWFVPKDKQKY